MDQCLERLKVRAGDSLLIPSGTMHAITLFRESLGVPGDENRNPMVAIEAGRLIPDTTA